MILGDVGTHGGVVIDATNKNRIVRKLPATIDFSRKIYIGSVTSQSFY